MGGDIPSWLWLGKFDKESKIAEKIAKKVVKSTK